MKPHVVSGIKNLVELDRKRSVLDRVDVRAILLKKALEEINKNTTTQKKLK